MKATRHKQFYHPDFYVIPWQIADDPAIEPLDEKVYAITYWFERMSERHECIASNLTIATVLNRRDPQPRSVQNSLNRLEQGGYIARDYKDPAKRNRLRIRTLVAFGIVRNGDDTRATCETAMIPERNGDDRHERNGDDQSNKSIYSKRDTTAAQGAAGEGVADIATPTGTNDLLKEFEPVNPSYERLYPNKTQRAALERLVKKWGPDKIRNTIRMLPTTNPQQFYPTITTPLQLEEKLGALVAAYKKQHNKPPRGITL